MCFDTLNDSSIEWLNEKYQVWLQILNANVLKFISNLMPIKIVNDKANETIFTAHLEIHHLNLLHSADQLIIDGMISYSFKHIMSYSIRISLS